MNRLFASLLSAACLVLAGAAVADEHPAGNEPGHGGDYPTAVLERPLELPKGMLEVEANLLANLSASVSDAAGQTFFGPFKPTFLGFGAAYGVDGHLQIGVSSTGLCLSGTSGSCSHVFDDLAVDAAYGVLHQRGLEVSLQGALGVAHLSGGTDNQGNDTPTEFSGALGIDLKATSGQFGVRAGPKLQFGLNQRDGANREYLQVPLTFIFQADPHLALSLGVALNLMLDPPEGFSFGDFLGVPVQVGALYAVDKHLDVGGVFGFSNLLGKESSIYGRSGFDDRFIQVFAAYRL
jgi:hypothetical protein